MQQSALTVTTDTLFAALPSQEPCRQALEILDRIGHNVEFMSRLIPFVPPGCVLFLTASNLEIPNRYLRILPLKPKSRDDKLCRYATEMGCLGKAGRIVFISTKHVDPKTGRFVDMHAERFEGAMKALIGYREPAGERVKPERHWKEELAERRQARRKDMSEIPYGRPLWQMAE